MPTRPIPSRLRPMHALPPRKGPTTGPAGLSEPPEWLPAAAQAEWVRIVAATAAHPTWLQAADLASLTAYVAAWAVYEEAARDVAARGALVPGRSSADTARDAALVKNPALQVMRDAGIQLRAWAKELGFTPDSRGRVDLGGVEVDDDEADIFGIVR